MSIDSPPRPDSVPPISFLAPTHLGRTNARAAPRTSRHVPRPQISLEDDEDDLFDRGPQPGPGDVEVQLGVRGSDEYGYDDWDEAGLLEAAKEAEKPGNWKEGMSDHLFLSTDA